MLYIYIRAVQLIKIQFRFWSPENAYCAPFCPLSSGVLSFLQKKNSFTCKSVNHVTLAKLDMLDEIY